MNKDVELLRKLAQEVCELANTPRMTKLKSEWISHNALASERPMICVSPEGSWNEILTEKELLCTDPFYRNIEYSLRQKLYWGLEIQDDTPISAALNIPYSVEIGF
ncbi:MAG: hypothetical protein RSC76_01005, partial [Oscillospiraceae bacterium]